MLRVLLLTSLICVYGGMLLPSVSAKRVLVNRRVSTQTIGGSAITSAANTNALPSITSDEVVDSGSSEEERYYEHHPTENKNPHIVEEFNHQYLDGSYEFKYVLTNGVTRYEKSYWKEGEKGKKVLARKGFYSYPVGKHKFLTVFYSADEYGFQQDPPKYTSEAPKLPKYLDVPELEFPHQTSTTTRKSVTGKPKFETTTRRPIVKPSSNYNWIY